MGTSSTAGYSGTPLSKKLGIKEAHRVLVLEAPKEYESLLAPLPPAVQFVSQPDSRVDMQAVERAMERLAKQGLSRHDCIHAVGWVLAQHLYEMATTKAQDTPEVTNARYEAAVERIDAKTWREQAGAE